jgi:hypothetical protein
VRVFVRPRDPSLRKAPEEEAGEAKRSGPYGESERLWLTGNVNVRGVGEMIVSVGGGDVSRARRAGMVKHNRRPSRR